MGNFAKQPSLRISWTEVSPSKIGIITPTRTRYGAIRVACRNIEHVDGFLSAERNREQAAVRLEEAHQRVNMSDIIFH